MNASKLRKKFIEFFVSKGHKEMPSVSLVPEDDPTILFTPAGMSPLVRYLMGESHPLGKKLCSVQKCVRTDDIEKVGDLTHFTFFEMLGNWSLGDYFKKDAIEWSFEFLTDKKWLDLDPKNIYISVFEGDKDVPKDEESIKVWQKTFKKAGIEVKEGDWRKPNLQSGERIFSYGKKENWWGPAGQTGPCGPDTEMFYDTGRPHNKKFGLFCHPNCNCGRFFEIWNNVFMAYNKKADGSFEPLKQQNVDTGMGLERVIALTEWLEGKIKEPDPFLSHLFKSLINQIEKETGKKYQDYQKEFRIIADHLRAAVFIIVDGVEPSNKGRGYVLRRLIRRVVVGMRQLNINILKTIPKFCQQIINIYRDPYFTKEKSYLIHPIIGKEADDFIPILNKGTKLLQSKPISGKLLFDLYQSYGFPFKLAQDLLFQWGKPINKKIKKEVEKRIKEHQEKSRVTSKGMFAGGLADHSEEITKLHTATHLLHQALRKVLDEDIKQVGSNITKERLRFDFTHSQALSKEEIKKIEDLVNQQIENNLKVVSKTLFLKEAEKEGALAFFGQKYPDKVKVYKVGDFSYEVCGGPHVDFTAKLGKFRINKEESCGAAKRRIYAVLL